MVCVLIDHRQLRAFVDVHPSTSDLITLIESAQAEQLKSYSTYMANQEVSSATLDRLMKSNTEFAAFINA
jgi:hypothetical protein